MERKRSNDLLRRTRAFDHASRRIKNHQRNPDLLVEEEHYRDLLRNVVDPFVHGFDNNPDDRPRWIDVRDTLLGPVAEAALKTVQQHQDNFFGKRLSSTTAVGAVTSALLGAAAEGNIGEVFTPEGIVRLYRSVLELSRKGDGPPNRRAKSPKLKLLAQALGPQNKHSDARH